MFRANYRRDRDARSKNVRNGLPSNPGFNPIVMPATLSQNQVTSTQIMTAQTKINTNCNGPIS
jgi:hypothetical protein